MISYLCDLCGNESGTYIFKIPIAATFIEGEPCDLIPVEMNLCKKCRKEIYKAVKGIVPQEKLKKMNKMALDIKMHRV